MCFDTGCVDVAGIKFDLNYVDANGKPLKTHQGSKSSNSSDKPLARRHQTIDAEVTAFFMPDEATDVEFALKSVFFTDGTDWTAESEARLKP